MCGRESRRALVMLKDTLKRMRAIIDQKGDLSADKKKELHDLSEQLHRELGQVEKVSKEKAESIAGFAQVVTHESLRENKSEELHHHSVQGLKVSAREFEVTHPGLMRVIQSICNAFGV